MTNTGLMADGQGNLSNFPELIIAPDDVSGSWNQFVEKFSIMVKWKTLDLGTKMVLDRSLLLWGLSLQRQIPPIMVH